MNEDAFNRMVLEKGLTPWEQGGYKYAGFKGPTGWELYRTSNVDWNRVPVSIGSTSNPAAGAEHATFGPPSGKKWLLVGGYYSLTTDANVANRYPYILIRGDGTSGSMIAAGNVAITASLTTLIGFGTVSGGVAGVAVSVGLGNGIEMPNGSNALSKIANIQAGDDATALYYMYKQVDA